MGRRTASVAGKVKRDHTIDTTSGRNVASGEVMILAHGAQALPVLTQQGTLRRSLISMAPRPAHTVTGSEEERRWSCTLSWRQYLNKCVFSSSLPPKLAHMESPALSDTWLG